MAETSIEDGYPGAHAEAGRGVVWRSAEVHGRGPIGIDEAQQAFERTVDAGYASIVAGRPQGHEGIEQRFKAYEVLSTIVRHAGEERARASGRDADGSKFDHGALTAPTLVDRWVSADVGDFRNNHHPQARVASLEMMSGNGNPMYRDEMQRQAPQLAERVLAQEAITRQEREFDARGELRMPREVLTELRWFVDERVVAGQLTAGQIRPVVEGVYEKVATGWGVPEAVKAQPETEQVGPER